MAPPSNTRTSRGATYMESLVAALIMGVCIMGIVSMWAFSYKETTHHEQSSMGYNLARRCTEMVKQKGFNFNEYTVASPLVLYYDTDGGNESGSALSTSGYKVTISVVSDRLDTNTSTGATRPNETALRTVIVTVRSYPDNRLMATTGTYLARSGV